MEAINGSIPHKGPQKSPYPSQSLTLLLAIGHSSLSVMQNAAVLYNNIIGQLYYHM